MVCFKINTDYQGKLKEYISEHNEFRVITPERSCFFCKYCTDIFWDYANGPYMVICQFWDMLGIAGCDKIYKGLTGCCDNFEEVNNGEIK